MGTQWVAVFENTWSYTWWPNRNIKRMKWRVIKSLYNLFPNDNLCFQSQFHVSSLRILFPVCVHCFQCTYFISGLIILFPILEFCFQSFFMFPVCVSNPHITFQCGKIILLRWLSLVFLMEKNWKWKKITKSWQKWRFSDDLPTLFSDQNFTLVSWNGLPRIQTARLGCANVIFFILGFPS